MLLTTNMNARKSRIAFLILAYAEGLVLPTRSSSDVESVFFESDIFN